MWSYLIAIISLTIAPWVVPVGVTIVHAVRTARQRRRERRAPAGAAVPALRRARLA